MKKKVMLCKILGGVIIVFLLILLPQTLGKAIIVTTAVDIIPVMQEKSNWCWAACAEICGKNANPNSTRTQRDVVRTIKGSSLPNVTGTLRQSEIGTEYVAMSVMDYLYGEIRLDYSQITECLAHGYAVQAAAGIYSLDGVRQGGHMVVINMTQFVDIVGENPYRLTYYDPNDGLSYTCTYEEFCNGSFNGRRYDQTVYVEVE